MDFKRGAAVVLKTPKPNLRTDWTRDAIIPVKSHGQGSVGPQSRVWACSIYRDSEVVVVTKTESQLTRSTV